MKRVVTFWAIVCSLLAASIAPALAEVKTKDKSQVKFEGMLGRMMGMFGGKAAKEGVVSTNAVKGDRKATINESTGRIIDLAEEKVYDLDMNKKTYQVTTFEELPPGVVARVRASGEVAQLGPVETTYLQLRITDLLRFG